MKLTALQRRVLRAMAEGAMLIWVHYSDTFRFGCGTELGGETANKEVCLALIDRGLIDYDRKIGRYAITPAGRAAVEEHDDV